MLDPAASAQFNLHWVTADFALTWISCRFGHWPVVCQSLCRLFNRLRKERYSSQNRHQEEPIVLAVKSPIRVTVNGSDIETSASDLAALIVDMDFAGERVATAVNGEFVR